MSANPMGLMPLSYSRLSRFENCPSSFEHLYVNKTVQDAGGEASVYGNRIHEALERYGRALTNADDATLAALQELEQGSETARWIGLVSRMVRRPGDKYFEHQMALDAHKTPCNWFDRSVWLRAIADVLIVNGRKAYCIDWKTGKKRDNPTQLQLFAAMIFAHFPDVQEVAVAYVWLAIDDVSITTYERRFATSLWGSLTPRFSAVQDAVELGVFPTKPSGLCPWCPAVGICPDARKKR